MAHGWNPLCPFHREATRGGITIYEYERGLLYVRGKFQRLLEAGRYRIWPFMRRRIVVVDLRRTALPVNDQKLLTADQITVTLNLAVDYAVSDPVAAVHRVVDCRSQLYADAQLAARNAVGSVAMDALLRERQQVNAQILEAVRPLAAGYGLNVVTAGIKDVILAAKVRDRLLKEAEATRTAQAMLIGAREEVAALRALANAARLAAEHPELLPLRQLDAVRAFAQTPGNTVVVGLEGRTVLPRSRTPPVPGAAPVEPGE